MPLDFPGAPKASRCVQISPDGWASVTAQSLQLSPSLGPRGHSWGPSIRYILRALISEKMCCFVFEIKYFKRL